MSSVESFLYLTARGHFSDAAHLLDLTDLPRADQATEGAKRARELSVVLERKVVIPWGSLADRPDGWLAGSNDDQASGRVRRSLLIDRMELDDHFVPLRLNRIKAGENADPVWVFSPQTVDNIPRLHELYGPTELEKKLPLWARAEGFWGMYVWEVLFLPLLLIVASILSFLAFGFLKEMGEKAPQRWMRFLGRSFRWPAAIALFAAVLGTGTREVLVVSGVLDAILNPVLVIAYVFAATLALVLIIDEVFDRISKSNPNELADPENSHLRSMATTISAARKFLIVIATLVGTGVVLTSVDTFPNLGLSLLASAGALTIVLGFAAREVLGNILSSVQIALNRSARIGDQLIFEGHFCTVERIHFTYVQLMIWNGTRLIVPVSYFVSDAFENWSLEDPKMVRPILMTLAQDADVDAMRKVFLDLLEREDDEDVHPKERAAVRVIDQDVFGLKVRFELPAANPATGWDIECRVREGLQKAARKLQSEGTSILPPSRMTCPKTEEWAFRCATIDPTHNLCSRYNHAMSASAFRTR
ncbi:mechanosensitive ion channel family protein [Sulfitobacter aestuariivivens]|uniref:mechanosensitive ion channel family protein n=1 Tax=Sulfitobacter aestuariivivens TaxID=2766981 RepID=UPI00361B8860